jgi:hypothetical protein
MSAVAAFLQSHFLNPAALWWLAILAPMIIVLYFLKLKRQELLVSSTVLWQQSIQDLRVNSPFQRIRRNLLLFIQLLILLVAVLALARPLMNLQQQESKRVIVLIDTSASMATEEMDGSRLDAAKKGALELVENMLSQDQMALIRFAAQASVVSSFTSDRVRLRQLINELDVEATETHLKEALNIGFSLAKVQTDEKSKAEIHLFSDGRFADTAGFLQQTGEVKYHPTGKQSRNVGIIALDVGYVSGDESASEVFFSVENFDALEAELTAEFHFNDALIGARKYKVPQGLRVSGLAPAVGGQEGVLRVRLVSGDPFPLDNTGYAAIRQPEKIKVLIVGTGDFFLNQALGVASTKLSRVAPSDYGPKMAEEHDVVLFDGWAPKEAGKGSFIFHNCHPGLADLGVGAEVEGPAILDYDRTHPVMRFFSLAEVFVLRMKKVKPPKWMRVLAQTDEGPLILCSEQEDFRCLYLPLHASTDSNLSAQGTFPIFVVNALRWLPTSGIKGARQLQTGETLIAQAGRADEATVTDPKGRKSTIKAQDGRILFPHTTTPGIYQVECSGLSPQVFAVNLLSAAESNIGPLAQFNLRGAAIQAEEAGVAKANREVWHWLALAAFFLLLIEWYIYNAKVYF